MGVSINATRGCVFSDGHRAQSRVEAPESGREANMRCETIPMRRCPAQLLPAARRPPFKEWYLSYFSNTFPFQDRAASSISPSV